jgi:uncharacterized membrane protein YtjA (UPF0391 family)
MARLALLFLAIALVAAFWGFGWVANLEFGPARILFFICLVLALLSFLANIRHESSPGESVRPLGVGAGVDRLHKG